MNLALREQINMKLAAISFAAYAFLVAMSIVAITIYNSSSGLPFLIKVAVVFGGLMVWAGSSAHSLWNGRGLVRSFLFVGLLTMIVFIGLAQYGTFQLEEGVPPALNALRTLSGVSLIWLWIVLFRALRVRHPQVNREFSASVREDSGRGG